MLSISLPAARSRRFVLLFHRETESWRSLVAGRRIPSKSEPEPEIKSRNPDSPLKCSKNTGFWQEHDFSCVLREGRQLLIFCVLENSFAPDSG